MWRTGVAFHGRAMIVDCEHHSRPRNARLEHQTGWSIKKFVLTARRYRTVQIRSGRHTFTAADPLPDNLRQAIDEIAAYSTH